MAGQLPSCWLTKANQSSSPNHDPHGLLTGKGGHQDHCVSQHPGPENAILIPKRQHHTHALACTCIQDLLGFIKKQGIKNVLFICADVHYPAAVEYSPKRAKGFKVCLFHFSLLQLAGNGPVYKCYLG